MKGNRVPPVGIVGSTRPSRIEARVYEFNTGRRSVSIYYFYLFKKGKNVERSVKAGDGGEREEKHTTIWGKRRMLASLDVVRLVPFCFFSRVQCHLFL